MFLKKCVFCEGRLFLVFGAFIGTTPFIISCRCTKRKVGISINWTFICLILGFSVVRLLIAIHDAWRLIADTSHKDFELYLLLLADMFIILEAVLSWLAIKSVKSFRSFAENIVELLKYYEYVSRWSKMEEKVIQDTYWTLKFCWLPSTIVGSAVYILSNHQFMAIMLAITVFILIQFLVTVTILIKLKVSILKCCYTDIMRCLSLECGDESKVVLRINTLKRLQRLVDFQKMVVKNYELLNKSATALILMYYISTVILAIATFTIFVLSFIHYPLMIFRTSFLMMGSLMIWVLLVTCYFVLTGTAAMVVGNDLQSFLFRYKISRLGKKEALLVETILETLNNRILVIRPADLVTINVKMYAEALHNILSYILVAVQFYLNSSKTN